VSFCNLDTEGARLNENNELILGMGVLEASLLPSRTPARTTLAFAGRFKVIFAAQATVIINADLFRTVKELRIAG
jgi:hypothetical protein